MNTKTDRHDPSAYPRVVMLDVSIGSKNVGDEIIADAVERVIMEIAPSSHLIRLPTHLPLGIPGLRLIRKAKLVFVGGSNLLSSNMLKYSQWKISVLDSTVLQNAVLLGTGWWQYQRGPDRYTRTLLKRVLSSTAPHVVRDSYSAKMLESLGILDVRNLSCPTTWFIDVEAVAAARLTPRDRVITTVTDYKPNVTRDNAMLEALRRRYRTRYLWLQGSEDYRYIAENLDVGGFTIVPPSLACYDAILREGCDYVGTRLHAGIRAMQYGCYAQIIPVDNRAIEMGRDFNLPLVTFATADELHSKLIARQTVNITLPTEEIAAWKREVAALL